MPSADFCVLVHIPHGLCSLASHETRHRPPEVSSTAFRAHPPDLRLVPLMDMGFAVVSQLARHARLVSGCCSSVRAFAPRFLQTTSRDVALALCYSFTSIRLE